MNHWKARLLIPSLLDEVLSQRVERRVRTHLADCHGCRRVLDEMKRAEGMLRALPAALVPVQTTRTSESRLAGLARWAPIDAGPRPAFHFLPALTTFAAASLLVFAVWTGTWAPVVHSHGQLTLAFAIADTELAPPTHWH